MSNLGRSRVNGIRLILGNASEPEVAPEITGYRPNPTSVVESWHNSERYSIVNETQMHSLSSEYT